MTADMKAAMEYAATLSPRTSNNQDNLAAAFLELSAELERERKAEKTAQVELNHIVDYIMGYWPLNFAYSNPLQAVTVLAAEMQRTQQHASDLQARLDRVKAETIGKVKELVCDQCKTKL